MVIKVKHLLLVIGLGIVSGIGVFFLYGSFDYDKIYENANVWYKVSSDELNPGEIVALDMSSGYSACEGPYIFLAVNAIESGEEMVIVFPNGAPWTSPGIDTISVEIQKNFGELEEDLRNGK